MQSSGESGRFTKIAHKLKNGYVAEVDLSKVVHIPSSWIHATFVMAAGGLIGINFESVDKLKTMSLSLAIHCLYMF